MSNSIKDLILNAKSITILSHINPDADALGTSLGIYSILKSNLPSSNIEVVNVSKDLPIYLDFLPNYNKIKHNMDYEDSLIIACDCGSIDRLGFNLDNRDIINIDHHKSNNLYGLVNIVKPTYASSSQVAYEVFKDLFTIDLNSAICFYTALVSDTKFFTTSSVNENVLNLSHELVALGVKPDVVASNFKNRRSLASFRILNKALSSLDLRMSAKVAVLSVTKDDMEETGAKVPDLDGIVDFGKSLVTVEIAIFVMQLDNELRVSLRSKTVDVSLLAKEFGGGGHSVASGFTLVESKLQETIDIIVDKIKSLRLLDG